MTVKKKFSAKDLDIEFYSSDLNRKITIKNWMLLLLERLIIEEEGFSGKRPFGNSGWKCDVEIALVKSGLLKGTVTTEEDGEEWLEAADDSTSVFIDIIKSMRDN